MSNPNQVGDLERNVAGMLAYSFVAAVIFLFLEPYKDDKFIRFHSLQAIIFGVASMVLFYGVNAIMSLIPFLGGYVTTVFFPLTVLFVLGVWGFCIYKAYDYEEYQLPYIGKVAAEQAGRMD